MVFADFKASGKWEKERQTFRSRGNIVAGTCFSGLQCIESCPEVKYGDDAASDI